MSEAVDVVGQQNLLGVSAGGGLNHGAAEVRGGRHIARSQQAQHGIERPEDAVHNLVPARARADAFERLDVAGTKHVGRFERQPKQRILGFAFGARPRGTSTLGAVRSLARDVTEGEPLRRGRRDGIGRRERQVICQVVIVALAHAYRRDAQAEKAGVTVGELRLDAGEVEEIFMDNFAQFWMAEPAGMPDNDEHAFDAPIVQAFEQRAFAHHARRAEDHDLHE